MEAIDPLGVFKVDMLGEMAIGEEGIGLLLLGHSSLMAIDGLLLLEVDDVAMTACGGCVGNWKTTVWSCP